MERWTGKVAIVTGASSGIGAAIVENLVNNDLKVGKTYFLHIIITEMGVQSGPMGSSFLNELVVGLARRKEKLDEMSEKFHAKNLYGIETDITNEDEILNAFKWVKENLGPISILINNAGILKASSLIFGSTSDFKSVLDTNILGLTIATREAVQDMKSNNIDGHVIHINSIAGHYVPNVRNVNVYPASKYAVTALTETLRQELNSIQSKIKITSISPGYVETELYRTNGYLDNSEMEELFKNLPSLKSKDIADAVHYVLASPSHVQITELTLRPVGEMF